MLYTLSSMWNEDETLLATNEGPLAGMDEAGRGPLAGPVVAAAYIAGPAAADIEVADSKRLTTKRREELYPLLIQAASAFAIGMASAKEIDKINVLAATRLAMLRALRALPVEPGMLLIDGNAPLNTGCPNKTVIGGDNRHGCIAAASIIAKVTRDSLMRRYARIYPGYQLETNMGYGTRAHMTALEELGPAPIHRTTFRGVVRLRLQV